MDIEMVKSLCQILNEGGLTALEVFEGDMRIRLEKDGQRHILETGSTPDTPPDTRLQAGFGDIEHSTVDFNMVKEVRSPMVGVFYAASGPEEPPFVKVGSRVEKGDVLCIIEAMKVMNEILAEDGGEIVDICVSNGDIVEFSQTLFKIC